MQRRKRIGLIAHDARKAGRLDRVSPHRDRLVVHALRATGTTDGFVIASPLFDAEYDPAETDYTSCLHRLGPESPDGTQ